MPAFFYDTAHALKRRDKATTHIVDLVKIQGADVPAVQETSRDDLVEWIKYLFTLVKPEVDDTLSPMAKPWLAHFSANFAPELKSRKGGESLYEKGLPDLAAVVFVGEILEGFLRSDGAKDMPNARQDLLDVLDKMAKEIKRPIFKAIQGYLILLEKQADTILAKQQDFVGRGFPAGSDDLSIYRPASVPLAAKPANLEMAAGQSILDMPIDRLLQLPNREQTKALHEMIQALRQQFLNDANRSEARSVKRNLSKLVFGFALAGFSGCTELSPLAQNLATGAILNRESVVQLFGNLLSPEWLKATWHLDITFGSNRSEARNVKARKVRGSYPSRTMEVHSGDIQAGPVTIELILTNQNGLGVLLHADGEKVSPKQTERRFVRVSGKSISVGRHLSIAIIGLDERDDAIYITLTGPRKYIEDAHQINPGRSEAHSQLPIDGNVAASTAWLLTPSTVSPARAEARVSMEDAVRWLDIGAEKALEDAQAQTEKAEALTAAAQVMQAAAEYVKKNHQVGIMEGLLQTNKTLLDGNALAWQYYSEAKKSQPAEQAVEEPKKDEKTLPWAKVVSLLEDAIEYLNQQKLAKPAEQKILREIIDVVTDALTHLQVHAISYPNGLTIDTLKTDKNLIAGHQQAWSFLVQFSKKWHSQRSEVRLNMPKTGTGSDLINTEPVPVLSGESARESSQENVGAGLPRPSEIGAETAPLLTGTISVQRGAASPNLNIRQAINHIEGKYAVAVDMEVFEALSDAQRAEFYKSFAAYAKSKAVKFIFNMQGDREMTAVYQELINFRSQYSDVVELRVNPEQFQFDGSGVVNISKEGVKAHFADQIENFLRQSKSRYVPLKYQSGNREPGLLTAALLLLFAGKEELIPQGQYFSEIPPSLTEAIENFLQSYVYIAKSA